MADRFRWRDVKSEPVEMEGAEGVRVRWLIDEKRGARNFAMRVFELAPKGHTPLHRHDYEHEVLVLEGKGALKLEADERTLEPGDVVWMPPGEIHQFRNAGPAPFFFMCLIPIAKKNG
jgi:quercetin dioxygenase-like cupin family protein